MKTLTYGLAAASLFLSGSALAQPAELTSAQLDQVTAGFFELDTSNTSTTAVSIWRIPYLGDPSPNTVHCSGCYLVITSPILSIASAFNPISSPPYGPPES